MTLSDEIEIDLATRLAAIDASASGVLSFDRDGLLLMDEEHARRVIAEWARGLADDRGHDPQSFFGFGGAPVHAAMEVTSQGVAIVKLHGTLAINGDLRWGVASTSEAQRQLARATADSDIRGILLSVDSPGGMAFGNYELSEAITTARRAKPTWTHANNVMASAAYWNGAQSEKVFASEMARVGGIGTYMAVPDISKALERAGVELKVFKAGKFKAMGLPGTEITEEQAEQFQAYIEAINEYFLKGVSKGRGLPIAEVRELGDGRAHLARKALELKLIDGVQSLPQTLAQLTKHVSTTSAGRSKSAMSIDTAAPVAATFQELKQTFPHADAAFREKCLEVGMTLDKARDAYAADLQTQLSAALQANEKLTSEKAALQQDLDAEKAKKVVTRPGAAALADSGNGPSPESSGDPVAAWNAAIEAKVTAGMPRWDAAKAVAKEQPELRQAFTDATSAIPPKSRDRHR